MPPQLKELMANGAQVEPLTVEQYHRMIASGILPEGEAVELLDGILVRKDRAKAGEDLMTVGTLHAWAVQNLARVLASDLVSRGCHLRTQQPITILPRHEPEPDGAIVVGEMDDYVDAHPGPEQVLCIIEVADSSLQHDRTTKHRIYGEAGIRQYVIINLVERVIESFDAAPGSSQYQPVVRLTKGQTLELQLGASTLDVAVDRLLP
jgi:Uma2 family endonuclease